jgi:hypothetical protein
LNPFCSIRSLITTSGLVTVVEDSALNLIRFPLFGSSGTRVWEKFGETNDETMEAALGVTTEETLGVTTEETIGETMEETLGVTMEETIGETMEETTGETIGAVIGEMIDKMTRGVSTDATNAVSENYMVIVRLMIDRSTNDCSMIGRYMIVISQNSYLYEEKCDVVVCICDMNRRNIEPRNDLYSSNWYRAMLF